MSSPSAHLLSLSFCPSPTSLKTLFPCILTCQVTSVQEEKVVFGLELDKVIPCLQSDDGPCPYHTRTLPLLNSISDVQFSHDPRALLTFNSATSQLQFSHDPSASLTFNPATSQVMHPPSSGVHEEVEGMHVNPESELISGWSEVEADHFPRLVDEECCWDSFLSEEATLHPCV